MKVGFQCPDNGVPIIGEWDEDTGEMDFWLEDANNASEFCSKEVMKEAEEWCMKRCGYFPSADDANRYLTEIGVKEQLGEW